MSNDLATIGINVVLQGQQETVGGLTQVANTLDNKVSPAAKRVIENFRQTQQMMSRVQTQTQAVNRTFNALDLQRVSQRMGSLENVLNNTRQGMNGFGVITQQAGYQVGDFIVQVQSGTNAFVAFGQQATQMVGFLPMLAAEMGKTSLTFMGLNLSMASVTLGLSIIIPLLTAIGAAWMRTSEDTAKGAEKQKNAYDQLRQSLDEYIKTKEAAVKGITVDQGTAVDKLKEASDKLIASRKELQIAQAGSNISLAQGGAGVATGAAVASLFGISQAQDSVTQSVEEELAVRKTISDLRDKMLESYARESSELALSGKIEAAKIQYGEDSLKYKQLQAEEDRNSYEQNLRSLDINEGYVKALMFQYDLIVKNRQQLEQTAILDERRREALELYNKNLADQNALNQERAAAVKKLVTDRDDELASLRQQRDLLETILTYGKDSTQAKAKEAEIARAVFMQEQMRNGILGNNLKLVMDEYDAMAKVKGEVDSAASSAKTFANNLKEAVSAMQSLTGLGSTIEKALAVASAKVVALKNNADAATAGTVAGYRFDIAQKRGEAIAAGVDPGFVNPIAAKQNADVTALEKALLQADQLGQSKSSGGKGPSEDTVNNKLEEIYKYIEVSKYMVEQENIAYEQRQDTLEMALQKRLLTTEEYNQLELDLASKHAKDIADIENQAKVQKLSTVLGTGAQILQAVGEHNEKAAKMARIFGAAQALADTYAGAAAALKLPFPANIAAAGSIISAGLGFVNAIKSGSSSARPSGRVGSATVAPTASAPAPQTVFIDSIRPDSLYSGETLINLFEAFYDENDKRGKVFMVAR